MASELHNELCLRAAKYLKSNGFGVCFDDRFQAVTPTGEIPDVMGFRNNVSCLIEVKVSRSDFLADKKKKFRGSPELGMGDWRFYLCPSDLIKAEELPEGWGLLYAKPKTIKAIHGWPANTQWINCPFESNSQAERSYMYSALRRMEIKGHLSAVYEKLEVIKV
ncbi:hypothetical protein [Paraglaciecola psychrophila]|nr:hypothetical protein [Paraglaciecola psychrophila]